MDLKFIVLTILSGILLTKQRKSGANTVSLHLSQHILLSLNETLTFLKEQCWIIASHVGEIKFFIGSQNSLGWQGP